MNGESEELALIEAARRGSVEAFNDLVEMHQSRAYNLAYRLIGDKHAAADATQEAFISAFNHLHSFRGGNFRAWLMQIVANATYDEMRKQKRRPTVSADELAEERDGEIDFATNPEDDPEQIALRHALSDAVQHCLDKLSLEYRTVAVLTDVQGYDYREAAEIVRTSLGTVKSRLSRARQKLRDCLQGFGELLPDIYRLKDQGTTKDDEE